MDLDELVEALPDFLGGYLDKCEEKCTKRPSSQRSNVYLASASLDSWFHRVIGNFSRFPLPRCAYRRSIVDIKSELVFFQKTPNRARNK